MPSSLSAGMLRNFIRIGRALTILPEATLDVQGSVLLAGDTSVEGTLTIDGGVLRLVPQADPPADPEEGMVYMDTDHKLYVHNGTAFAVVGSQS